MALQKLIPSLMVSIMCIQQIVAGSGSSTPLKEEQEGQPEKIRRTTRPPHTDNIDREIAGIGIGIAALTIGAVGYGLYEACKESDKPSKKIPSQDFEAFGLQTHERENTRGPCVDSRKQNALKFEDTQRLTSSQHTFSYSNESFDVEAWKKQHGLSNNFSPSRPKERYGYPSHSTKKLTEEPNNNPRSDSDYCEIGKDSKFLEVSPVKYFKDCPLIDLSYYNEAIPEGRIATIDLHPLYNKDFRKYLRDEVFKLQRAYHLSETTEKKVYISTGTGKGRPGPDYTLQNTVSELLKTDYFWRRIAYHRLEKEGLFAIFLRKNIKQ